MFQLNDDSKSLRMEENGWKSPNIHPFKTWQFFRVPTVYLRCFFPETQVQIVEEMKLFLGISGSQNREKILVVTSNLRRGTSQTISLFM